MAKNIHIKITREQCAEEVRLYALACNKINALDAEMNAELIAIRERFEQAIEAAKNEAKKHAKLVEAWAMDNPDEFPPDKKSVEFPCGTIGHRTGTPTVATIGGWTLGRALKVILAKGAREFVSVKETLSKESILAAFRKKEITTDWLREVGLEVRQNEKFFIDPKLEETETHAD